MRLEHHLVGGYVRYISPYIIIIIIHSNVECLSLVDGKISTNAFYHNQF